MNKSKDNKKPVEKKGNKNGIRKLRSSLIDPTVNERLVKRPQTLA